MLPLARSSLLALCCILFSTLSAAQTATAPAPASNAATTTSASPTSSPSSSFATASASRNTTTTTGRTSTTSSSAFDPSAPPDVYLNVPRLHVGRIELDVDDLRADINLNAVVARGLVSINAGVAVSVQKVNITIADVDAELELVVRLGHLVDIVNRVFDSLDLNPLLISTVSNVTSILDDVVVGAVDGLLGSVTQGGTKLSFLVDNLGNIVQEVTGGADGAVSSIVGNYKANMTETGAQQSLGDGYVKKTFSYSPLNALVDIVFDSAGRVVQAVVQGKGGSGGGSGSGSQTSSSAAGTSTVGGTSTPVAR
ncbi:uncharacterized protein K452DRAFT_272939 [Aplosporella prunicola CBS 121167]|uniref:Uncharacterized protein n=1 Tax=Aplosporella prunicola CBS 121167 TaxID=1176127 RepID=A0A6A6BAS3_9PEZI|nr:uncharacterized protein K452DRAFT_272939 [Aplosporella prunicola CBS 121167]KAF2141116.1 hypothetical protein K452DRAFT_272939 [Aplosporella prunicola CBS 121167]